MLVRGWVIGHIKKYTLGSIQPKFDPHSQLWEIIVLFKFTDNDDVCQEMVKAGNWHILSEPLWHSQSVNIKPTLFRRNVKSIWYHMISSEICRLFCNITVNPNTAMGCISDPLCEHYTYMCLFKKKSVNLQLPIVHHVNRCLMYKKVTFLVRKLPL